MLMHFYTIKKEQVTRKLEIDLLDKQKVTTSDQLSALNTFPYKWVLLCPMIEMIHLNYDKATMPSIKHSGGENG